MVYIAGKGNVLTNNTVRYNSVTNKNTSRNFAMVNSKKVKLDYLNTNDKNKNKNYKKNYSNDEY